MVGLGVSELGAKELGTAGTVVDRAVGSGLGVAVEWVVDGAGWAAGGALGLAVGWMGVVRWVAGWGCRSAGVGWRAGRTGGSSAEGYRHWVAQGRGRYLCCLRLG